MVRTMLLGVVGSLLAVGFVPPVAAQHWAQKMFEVTSHDFGTIARGAKAEFAFELTNLYLENVRIAGVRSSCGCTSPRIEPGKTILKTYEKGAIVARINSGSFLGRQGATVTVTFDKPTRAQVQLHVKAYVYSNVLLEPASVAFGTVPVGTSAEQTVAVRFSGRTSWRVLEVKSHSPYLTGRVTGPRRGANQVAYDLHVALEPNAPPGYLREYLWLVTNDSRAERIPVLVEGQLLPAVAVSPSSLFLGVVRAGQSVTKQIVVRGQEPFHITAIHAESECLKAALPTVGEPKTHYLIPVTFVSGTECGRISQRMIIETDSGERVELTACAVVEKSAN